MTDQLASPNRLFEGSFRLTLPVSWILTLILSWSWLCREIRFPFHTTWFGRILFICLAIFCIQWLYKSLEIKLNLHVKHFLLFGALTALVMLFNGHILLKSIAGDELYHAELASVGLNLLKVLADRFPMWEDLRVRPASEWVSVFHVLIICILSAVFWLSFYLRLRYSLRVRNGLLFVLLVTLGVLFEIFPARLEMHPPLRLLPVAISQMIFGFTDLGLRMAGVVGLSALATVAYFSLNRIWRAEFCLVSVVLMLCIPTVLHSSGIVEPSFWAFCAWPSVYLILLPILQQNGGNRGSSLRSNDWIEDHNRLLVLSGLTIGCLQLARQNAILLWPVLGLFLLKYRPHWKVWVYSLSPGLWFLPTYFTIAQFQHPASQGASVANIWRSLETGIGPQILMHSSSVLWICLLLILTLVILGSAAQRGVWPFVFGFFPSYALYFYIWDYLWGLGRYQAEFVGGLTAVLILHCLPWLLEKLNWRILLPLLGFASYGVYFQSTTNHDIHYDIWPRKRISTESTFPYIESLGFLHRQQTEGHFVFLGGVPIYGDLFLYLRGFSLSEARRFRETQDAFMARAESVQTISELLAVLQDVKARWLVVQYGDKRELQHRNGSAGRIIELLGMEKIQSGAKRSLPNPYVFVDNFEGAIDLYPLTEEVRY